MVAAFKDRVRAVNPHYTTFDSLQTLQVNLGNLCNLSCNHCHLSASPSGNRVMGPEVMDQVAAFLSGKPWLTLDLTGGCPELNPHFRHLIEITEGLVRQRLVRSNLVILQEPGMEWLPGFLASRNLTVIASLPCYQEENVDRQRGREVFRKNIQVLQTLNSLGYGRELELNLVYNPGGAHLPGSQPELETAYKAELLEKYGIAFNHLYTITNAPLGRFGETLRHRGTLDQYLNTLAASFNPGVAGEIMCRSLISVDYQGRLYNCDFNQTVGLPITGKDGRVLTIGELDQAAIGGMELKLAQHCYCCTAGEGSSCTGTLS